MEFERRCLHPMDCTFCTCTLIVVCGALGLFLLAMEDSAATTTVLPARVSDAWPEVGQDLTKVTWAHAVNSKNRLDEALEDDSVMMLEADVSLGSTVDREKLPMMAHSAETPSDLALEDFLSTISEAVKKGKKKGIKLDFKDIAVVEDSLILASNFSQELGAVPLWLNADVLRGPGSSSSADAVDGNRFLSLCSSYMPGRVLSLGWTTSSGAKGYDDNHVDQMLKLLKEHEVDKTPLTFPVRASLVTAPPSRRTLKRLLAQAGAASTLTIWRSQDEVDAALLSDIVEELGRDKVYLDLPPDLKAIVRNV